eukprot:1137807-Pelagomonas_calceolata.AAC.8
MLVLNLHLQKVQGMPPAVQPQLQEAVEQLQAYCSRKHARQIESRSGADRRAEGALEQEREGRLGLGEEEEEEGGVAGGDEKVLLGMKEGQHQEPLVYNSEVGTKAA